MHKWVIISRLNDIHEIKIKKSHFFPAKSIFPTSLSHFYGICPKKMGWMSHFIRTPFRYIEDITNEVITRIDSVFLVGFFRQSLAFFNHGLGLYSEMIQSVIGEAPLVFWAGVFA